MTTELVKIKASDYGLEESKANEIESLFLPMLSKMSELENEYNDILKEEINPETCQRAKDLRLSYVKIRTGTADIHKKAKEFYLNGGRFVDGWKNAQIFASGEKEKTLKNIEDHFENQEKERLEKLRLERSELLKPYTEIEPLALGHMQQDVFDNYLTGIKIAHEAKIAAEKKAEEDRLAAIEAERIRIENQRIENERLKAEAIEKERLAEIERKKNAKILADQKAKADKERTDLLAKAEIERKEKERLAEIERKKNAKILADQKAKADKERTDLLAKAEIERKEKERLAEIERKKNAKILADQKAKADKERTDLLAKAEIERKEKERLEREIETKRQAEELLKRVKAAAEKAAKLAPDKTKLLEFMQKINDLVRPDVTSIEAANIASNANTLLVKVANYIKENADKL